MSTSTEIAKVVFFSSLMIASGGLLVYSWWHRRPVRRARHSPATEIDERIDVLERLLRQADETIARLESAEGRTTRLTADGLSAATSQRATAPERDTGVEHDSAAEGGLQRRVDPATDRLISPATRRQDEIYALADAGLDGAAIARRLGAPVGEVELILGLRSSRQ